MAIETKEQENEETLGFKTVNILYDYQHDSIPRHVKRLQEKINKALNTQNHNTRINIEFADSWSFKEKVNGMWDILLMHVGREGDACNEAYKIRDLSNALVVAESTNYPSSKKLILEDFDEYIDGFLYFEGGTTLINLLKKRRYIPQNFKWED